MSSSGLCEHTWGVSKYTWDVTKHIKGVSKHIWGVSKHTWDVSKHIQGVSNHIWVAAPTVSLPGEPGCFSREGRQGAGWGPAPATLPDPPVLPLSHQGQRDSASWDGASDFQVLVVLGSLDLAGVP